MDANFSVLEFGGFKNALELSKQTKSCVTFSWTSLKGRDAGPKGDNILGHFDLSIHGKVCACTDGIMDSWQFVGEVKIDDRYDFDPHSFLGLFKDTPGGRTAAGEQKTWLGLLLLYGNPYEIVSTPATISQSWTQPVVQ
ncbi:MAG: hypothetical protein KDC45_14080 [Bacteroidetes bacterium]|nr:hypothetical protein [Bacteroidota bacterium]